MITWFKRSFVFTTCVDFITVDDKQIFNVLHKSFQALGFFVCFSWLLISYCSFQALNSFWCFWCSLTILLLVAMMVVMCRWCSMHLRLTNVSENMHNLSEETCQDLRSLSDVQFAENVAILEMQWGCVSSFCLVLFSILSPQNLGTKILHLAFPCLMIVRDDLICYSILRRRASILVLQCARGLYYYKTDLNRHISCHHNQVFLLLDMGFHTHQSPTPISFPTTTLLLLFFFFTPHPRQWCILKFQMLSPFDDNHNRIQYITPFQNPPWCCWPMDMEMYMDMPNRNLSLSHTHTHTYPLWPLEVLYCIAPLHPSTTLFRSDGWKLFRMAGSAVERFCSRMPCHRQTDKQD